MSYSYRVKIESPVLVKLILVAACIFLLQACKAREPSNQQEQIVTDSQPVERDNRPSFIIFLTDDQRADTLARMPITQSKLVAHGTNFTQAIVTNPECCPFRASFLSGGFHSKNTGVLRNSPLNGTSARLNESDTLATIFSSNGYRTGYVGRYMHGYQPSYVPPGWDFLAMNSYVNAGDYNQLSDVTFYDDGVVAVRDVEQYVTEFQESQALRFIDKEDDRPFLLVVGFYAPHGPFIPAEQDKGMFSGYVLPRTEQFGEDVSDKPDWVQRDAAMYRKNTSLQKFCTETAPRGVLELLQSVDRAVGRIVDLVVTEEDLEDTVLILTSDNGRSYGEHDIQCDKGHPYEEALRVPFVVRTPTSSQRNDDSLVAANLDIGATIADMAGLPYRGDGLSLAARIAGDDSAELRQDVFIENFGYLEWRLNESPIWSGYRSKNWKYIEHGTGEKELYNLLTDPLELTNISSEPEQQNRIHEFSSRLESEKGIAVTDYTIPTPKFQTNYSHQLNVIGGTEPFDWQVIRGSMPSGLNLNRGSGLLSGVPNQRGQYSFTVEVKGSRILPHPGRLEAFRRAYKWEID